MWTTSLYTSTNSTTSFDTSPRESMWIYALITCMREQWIPGLSFGVGGAWVRGYMYMYQCTGAIGCLFHSKHITW